MPEILYSQDELEAIIEDTQNASQSNAYPAHVWARNAKVLCDALSIAVSRLATTVTSYNSIGKINADQALEIRELRQKLHIKETKK